MKKTFLRTTCRVIYTAVAAALIAVGCVDNGIEGKSSKVGDFVNMFADGGNNDVGTPPTHGVYTLTVNLSPMEGGTVSRNPNADSYAAGTRVTVTATPNNGYTFLSWSGAQNSTNAEVVIVMDDNKTLSAGFNDGRQTYDVYFNANSATRGDAPSMARAVEGNTITLPDQASMEKPGYSFIGWTENSNGTGNIYAADFSYIVTRRITLYAKWVPIYTVTFNTNNATSGDAPAAVTVDSGTAIKLPNKGNMVKSELGYRFGGWSTSRSGVGDDYADGATYIVTGDVTLYARWNKMNLPEVGVAYDGNGNKGQPIANTLMLYEIGTEVTLRDKWNLEKDGYYLDGWCTDPSCTGTVYPEGSSYILNNSVTFYARWVALPNYTVTFNGNGAPSGDVPAKVETYSGNSITLPSMMRTGYTFDGWNTNNSGTGTGYAAGSSYTVTGTVTLFAKWTETVVYGTLNYGGQTYKTVVIGGKRWMGENLNYNKAGESWCYGEGREAYVDGGWKRLNKDEIEANCAKYGRLYTWATAMGLDTSYNHKQLNNVDEKETVRRQGVCPSGWHLPTNAEWDTLVDFVGSSAGLKAGDGWYNFNGVPEGNGTDDFGFSALPSGSRNSDGTFNNVGNGGFWWTATEGYSFAYHRNMYYGGNGMYSGFTYKEYGFAVRCVED